MITIIDLIKCLVVHPPGAGMEDLIHLLLFQPTNPLYGLVLELMMNRYRFHLHFGERVVIHTVTTKMPAQIRTMHIDAGLV